MKYQITERYDMDDQAYEYFRTIKEPDGVSVREAYKDFCHMMRTEGEYWRSLDKEAESLELKAYRAWQASRKYFEGWVSCDWMTHFHNAKAKKR